MIELLEDSVLHGASIGFLLPLPAEEVAAYWDGVLAGLATNRRILLISEQGGKLQGAVQLEIPSKTNGSHRAEVQKLLVHSYARSTTGQLEACSFFYKKLA